MENMARKW